MTRMLASVTGPEEAEIVLAGGADIVDLKDPMAGALGAVPVERVAETVAAIAGRRPVSAVTGDLPMQPEAVAAAVRTVAATGVDYVKVGLFPEEGRDAVVTALAELAPTTALIGVFFADRDPDCPYLLPRLAEAGFTGVMLDTADKSGGRLLRHAGITSLGAFVKAAREHRLLVGLAGGLEQPDVPRLLQLQPDFLGFRGALCGSAGRTGALNPAAVRAIRRLIPSEPEARPANVDYRLLSARGWHPDTAEREQASQRIFVRDYVLPVRIGAYSHEREAPQKVRFDVTVEVERPRGELRGMAQVLSYDLITDGIASLVAEGHVDFAETLAERIARLVLSDRRARHVTVRVEKLELGPGGVGVEISMARQDPSAQLNPVLAMLDDGPRKPR
jgi:FolB domain-containing protein